MSSRLESNQLRWVCGPPGLQDRLKHVRVFPRLSPFAFPGSIRIYFLKAVSLIYCSCDYGSHYLDTNIRIKIHFPNFLQKKTPNQMTRRFKIQNQPLNFCPILLVVLDVVRSSMLETPFSTITFTCFKSFKLSDKTFN